MNEFKIDFTLGMKLLENYMKLPPKIIIDAKLLKRGNQFKFPKSRKQRINKKWSKRDANFRYVPDPNFYFLDNGQTIICHPSLNCAVQKYLYDEGYLGVSFPCIS